jgi:hypothetical protein
MDDVWNDKPAIKVRSVSCNEWHACRRSASSEGFSLPEVEGLRSLPWTPVSKTVPRLLSMMKTSLRGSSWSIDSTHV